MHSLFMHKTSFVVLFFLIVQELGLLDWGSRMRIIMGVAYCLQCMHDLSPPVVHMHLDTEIIYLTDDYAAKVSYN